MSVDPYKYLEKTDWVVNKKKTNKQYLCFERKVEVTLHKDHALLHINAETFKEEKVHGEVELAETKLIDKQTSAMTIYRHLGLREKSIVTPVIP